MLALIGNLDFSELMIVLFVAILIWGKNLPKVAGQAGAYVAKLRRQLDQMWRETGMDREIRDVQRNIQDIRNVVPRDMSMGEMARIASKEIERRLEANERIPVEEGQKTIDVSAQAVPTTNTALSPHSDASASTPASTNSHPAAGEAPLYGPTSNAPVEDPASAARGTDATAKDAGGVARATEPTPVKTPLE